MVETSVEARNWLINRLQEGGQDVLRGLAEAMIHALMNSEADAICGARYGERSPDRVNHRNGYRERQLDTRLGTLELQVPKLREGSYLPGWILEPRRRIEKALVAVVAECYVAGVSTRKVEHVVQTLGIEGISKSQVSEMARSLDAQVEAFRNRPLDRGPYRYVWLDALVVRCRELGRIVNVAVVVGTGINKEGSKEVLGVDVITSEDGAGWAAFLRTLVGRGLSGVELVISDAHVGLKHAIAAKPVILAAGTPRVLLPYDNASIFVKALEQHKGPLASWSAWVAPTSMKTALAAQQLGMSEATLRDVNRIPPRMVIKAGSTLVVPRSAHRQADVSEHVADNATIALAPDAPALRRVVFRAGNRGDSVAAVAQRYRVSTAQVAQWNNVSTATRFTAGSTVVVFVPARAAKAAPARKATAAKVATGNAAARKR